MLKKRKIALILFFTVATVALFRLFYKTDPINLVLVLGGVGFVFGVLFDMIIERKKRKK